MNPIVFPLFVLLLLATDDKFAIQPAPKLPLGKDTTYVTGPLDKDGYVDYAAALNERLGKGVTPANNANVLLWKALGPHPEGATMPYHSEISMRGSPSSAKVGISGTSGWRCGLAAASTRSLPAVMNGSSDGAASNMMAMRPATRSTTAGPLPR